MNPLVLPTPKALVKPGHRSGRGTGHTPGRTITHPDGTRYIVQASGAWQRVTPRHA